MGLVLGATGFSGGSSYWVAYILAVLENRRTSDPGLKSIF